MNTLILAELCIYIHSFMNTRLFEYLFTYIHEYPPI